MFPFPVLGRESSQYALFADKYGGGCLGVQQSHKSSDPDLTIKWMRVIDMFPWMMRSLAFMLTLSKTFAMPAAKCY